MAENSSSDQSTGTADRPATTQQAQKRSSVPAVFGDGSTKEQQDQLIREAKEANEATKAFADQEREARSS
jgi:hypothetical protein